ncbi:MAG: MBL fold metallo-hydrolase [Candidatus Omnitrophica bacterium]|nr:MBL fold metallo-hydrolase [Candidatus Omnitrophota bacterium]MCM8776737.1 MBL fold metallo-hydrolase [Candidatus Omnitrophota bacterium]
MRVKFLGATKNVTGSKTLLDISGKYIIIDCGLFQERELKDRNWLPFPVPPSSIDAIILTHAHLDHCGYIPKLVNDGFKGDIFCTEPTAEIAKIALQDAGKVQEEDAEKKMERHLKEGRKSPFPVLPLYTAEDAKRVFPLFKTYPYEQPFELFKDVYVSFYDAGHILGSAMIKIEIATHNGKMKKLIFSGDIGRWDKPILKDPTIFKEADIVFMESTYGNKDHKSEVDAGRELAEVINTTVNRGGNIVIPTFAIERTQEILYFLSRFLKEDVIPHILVFVDSPMAIDITQIFNKYPKYLDEKTQLLIKKGAPPFDFPLLKLTRTVDESKSINYISGSVVIMAGSGMCTGGRIKHHLITNITREESTVVFVGYQAQGTLGREILEKPENVRILGREYPVKATIKDINGFSAHAGKTELLKWIDGFEKPPEKIFVIHGEQESSLNFAGILRDRKPESEIIIPDYLYEYEI